jgi:hypothetical protein
MGKGTSCSCTISVITYKTIQCQDVENHSPYFDGERHKAHDDMMPVIFGDISHETGVESERVVL